MALKLVWVKHSLSDDWGRDTRDDKYRPYDEWKKLDNKDSYYTLSQGDYIFLTEISDDFLPNTIIQLKNNHKGMVCEVRSIIEVPKRHGATIRLKVSGV